MVSQNDTKKTGERLFNYLKFTGFEDLAVAVTELVDIDTAIKILQRDKVTVRSIFQLIHLLAHEIEHLKGMCFIRGLLVIKIDE